MALDGGMRKRPEARDDESQRVGSAMDGEDAAEYELNDEIDDTLHCSVGSRLSLFARELKSHSSSALRLPVDWYGSFVIHPNGR